VEYYMYPEDDLQPNVFTNCVEVGLTAAVTATLTGVSSNLRRGGFHRGGGYAMLTKAALWRACVRQSAVLPDDHRSCCAVAGRRVEARTTLGDTVDTVAAAARGTAERLPLPVTSRPPPLALTLR
jgi:hypothetical protein